MTTDFRITYDFFDESHDTEIEMLINGENVLAFERDGMAMTTRWDLDELTEWLENFIDYMKEDPYPVETDGEYAAMKDITARYFDTDDEDEFDAYYDELHEWCWRHRWHPASSGAILADIYFQLVKENVEISWNNLEPEEGVTFKHELGGVSIPKEIFIKEVNEFLEAYDEHWGLNKVKGIIC